jgi:hypothetical protein
VKRVGIRRNALGELRDTITSLMQLKHSRPLSISTAGRPKMLVALLNHDRVSVETSARAAPTPAVADSSF